MYFGDGFDSGVLVPIFSMAIPIVAIVGGITAGVVRMILKARMMELAQRERIAAIERGVDPSKLPPVPNNLDPDSDTSLYTTPRQVALNKARGLMVGGLVTLGVGLGLGLMLGLLAHNESEPVWSVGLIPTMIGIALILSSWFMHRAADQDERTQPTPPSTPHH